MQFSRIKLTKITNSDARFLYLLLMERDPKTNISHRKMPTYNEHRKFIASKPYKAWYVIKVDNIIYLH